MYIKLKKGVPPEPINALLKEKYNISNRGFVTEEMVMEIVDEINTNPKRKHLKPNNRNATRADVEKLFTTWTEIGLFETDLYYGRTSKEEMKKISEFIIDNADKIEYITDVETLLDRGEIYSLYSGILINLEKKEQKPEKLPKEKQQINDLQSGLLLCKSWSTDPIWVVFGKVEKPTFLKDKIYADEDLNSIYRDKAGMAYLLIPLNDMSTGFAEKVVTEMWNMGIRENPYFLLSYLYKYDIKNHVGVATKFAEFYSKKELIKRFQIITNKLKGLFPDIKIAVEGDRVKYVSLSEGLVLLRKYENLANCFIIALNKHYGKLMSVKGDSLVFKKGVVVINKDSDNKAA